MEREVSKSLDSFPIRTSRGEAAISCVVCDRVIDKGETYYDNQKNRTHVACFVSKPKADQLVVAPPRKDGLCLRCGYNKARTRDGRFCGGCLRRVVAEQNP